MKMRDIDLLCAEHGISRRELSKRSGVGEKVLYNISRKNKAQARTVSRIAAGLGVPVSEIIADK